MIFVLIFHIYCWIPKNRAIATEKHFMVNQYNYLEKLLLRYVTPFLLLTVSAK